MSEKPRRTTDAAQEFAKLMKVLVSHNSTVGMPAHQSLDQIINGSGRSNAVVMAYAAINRRSDSLVKILNELDDIHIDDETRQIGIDAVRHMQGMFEASRFTASWSSLLASHLRKEHLVSLAFLSPIVGRHHPLAAIRSEEAKELTNLLNEAVDEVSKEKSLPLWAKEALIYSIDDFRFILQNFLIFGHDEAISKLSSLLGITSAVGRTCEPNGERHFNLIALLTALVLAVDLFTGPQNMTQSFVTYRGWLIDLVEAARPMLAPPPKQIEGPKQTQVDKA